VGGRKHHSSTKSERTHASHRTPQLELVGEDILWDEVKNSVWLKEKKKDHWVACQSREKSVTNLGQLKLTLGEMTDVVRTETLLLRRGSEIPGKRGSEKKA